jgi:hypothetical protein
LVNILDSGGLFGNTEILASFFDVGNIPAEYSLTVKISISDIHKVNPLVS